MLLFVIDGVLKKISAANRIAVELSRLFCLGTLLRGFLMNEYSITRPSSIPSEKIWDPGL
jgi:hypothetical protein